MNKMTISAQAHTLVAKIIGIGEKLPSMLTSDDTGVASIHMQEFLEYGATAWRNDTVTSTQIIRRRRCGVDDLFLEKFVTFGHSLGEHLTTEELQRAIRDPGYFLRCAATVWQQRPKPIGQIELWSKFYNDVLRYTGVKFQPKILPDEHPGFTQLVVFHEGLTMHKVLEALRELCGAAVFYEQGLQSVHDFLTDPIATPDHTYAVLVRRSATPDKEHLGKSAAVIRDQQIASQSLLGRLLLHAFHFWKHSEHLDETCMTICAGSSFLKGDVPVVYWHRDKLRIERQPSILHDPTRGIRQLRISAK